MSPLLPNIASAFQAAAPFQLTDAAFVVRNKKVVLGHKTGLGKTFISLLAWAQWPDVNRVLILGSSSAIFTWRRIITQWGGVPPVIMKGSGDPAWVDILSKRPGIWLCTYATFRILMGSVPKPKHISVDLFINDELHKALRNRTQTYNAAKRVDCKYYIGATATWASKGPQDLWPVLSLADRQLFPSFWRFVETWCFVNDASYGKEIFGVRNADKLKALLASRFYRTRTWKEVGSQFLKHELAEEPVIRRSEVVEMAPDQEKLYNSMDSSMEVRFGGKMVLAQNSLDKLTKSLQLAISPKLLLPTAPVGSAIEWLADKVLDLDSVVVFIPFKGLAKITAEYLFACGYKRDVYSLYGGISPEICEKTIEAWRKYGGTIFCTISYAQSFALDKTDYAFFLGYDWDPNNNIQAEGRLRRMDSVFDVPCLATYIVVGGTVYDKVKEVINGKVDTVRQVLSGYGL